MKCIDCNATGYGLHHSAACKYLNVDIYKRVEQLQAENKRLEEEAKKAKVKRLEKALDYAKSFIDGYGKARIKENLGRDGMDAVLKEIDKIIEPTDICPVCGNEKPIDDLHRNCGK